MWSSGTRRRIRTEHLRLDPRAALFVFDSSGSNPASWLGLEATVTILEGPDSYQESVELFRVMQAGMRRRPATGHLFWEGQEGTVEEFVRIMEEEERLIYEFEISRT